jgi:hypothetical protein
MVTDKGINQPALFGKQGLTTQTLLPQLFQGDTLGAKMRGLHGVSLSVAVILQSGISK